MNILLVSMPDSFEHMPTVGIRMPNGALSALAGNVDSHHRVAVADLILVQREVRATVERLVHEWQPALVGLSVMTFQRKTALRIIELVRALRPGVRIAVGGYDPSLAPEAYTDPTAAVDFIVRGEGELTFRELVRALEGGGGFENIAGLSYREGDGVRHNPDRPVYGLAGGEIRLPNRGARGPPLDAGLDDLDYLVQAMTSAIAAHGTTLAPLMRQAGFRYVFLGIENILDDDLRFLRARAKNALRANGKTLGNATTTAIEHLHRHGMYVVGGLIVGNPDDTRESIEANLAFARRWVDYPYIQHPTPYPRTPMTREFRERGLVINENLEEYDGTTAVVRSEHVAADEIEFLRWRAERWMKVRHMRAVLKTRPGFLLRNWRKMLTHTFRGGSFVMALLGLEDERRAFARYRAIRKAERLYV